ncbi:MAG: cbb3-type cytochrome oxidase assembly protein CcoS [Oligoflexia bacterium]|nr:cbb3-type cytochrome oxidase assembly protein CcoS [Oligoflexia bacterium]
MEIVYLLVPVSVLLALAFLLAYIWSVRGGQLEDLNTPALRMLHDDEPSAERKAVDKIPHR